MLSGELFVRLIVFCSKLQFLKFFRIIYLQVGITLQIAYHENLQKLYIYKVRRVKNENNDLWKSKTIFLMNTWKNTCCKYIQRRITQS